MKVISLALCFSQDSDPAFLQRTQYITDCMTGNVFFPDPVPTMELVTEAVTQYGQSLTAAAGRDQVAVAQKNQRRRELEDIMGKLGLYVMFTAMGESAALTSSGFPQVKPAEPRYIVNPGNVTLTNGVSGGQIECRVKHQKAARSYLHQIIDSEPTESTVWDTRTSSSSRYLFSGLIPGKKYWIRVAVVGPGDQVAYSPVASMYAQ
jgi:hypothetical protein